MAPELDMSVSVGMGMGIGVGMGVMPMSMMGMEATPSSFSTKFLCGMPNSDAMRIDDLLDFSNKDDHFDAASAAENYQHGHLPMHEPSATAAAAGSFDTPGYSLSSFCDDFYMPSEEVAELEWLSKFVDDSFAEFPFPATLGGCSNGGEGAAPSSNYNALRTEYYSAIPARARSKRSRAPATAFHPNTSTWSSPPPHSPLFMASPTSPSPSLLELPPGNTPIKPKATAGCSSGRKKEAGAAGGPGMEGGVRRCTHCSSEKTPQWRTGPLGPKTLCNACGVRYKSGRLVPEYRPAASPTFVLTQHSNSHRKVMELRRQKELLLHHQGGSGGASPSPASPSARPGLLFPGYETC